MTPNTKILTGGAPLGNTNATKARPWSDAIRRALARAEADGNHRSLNKLAEKLLDMAVEGDMTAMKELGDRLEGKPAQAIIGEANSPIELLLRWQASR